MNTTTHIIHNQVDEAVVYLDNYANAQTTIDTNETTTHLTTEYLNNLFMNWANYTANEFMRKTSPVYIKSKLKQILVPIKSNIILQPMTACELKNRGENLSINYSFNTTLFGNVLIASTTVGICYIAFFDDDETTALSLLKLQFTTAHYAPVDTEALHERAIQAINANTFNSITPIILHLKGTPFQLNVWNALLKIPVGNLCTYSTIAQYINSPKAHRAVGTAIGSNPVAVLIPCHRVVQATGAMGGYMWGITRKKILIGVEDIKS
jgi:AraC family transcriptional regulator of adaptative response/methylated-DNA-[protein]-cysteine methyltransferase